ncbi:MAG: hypothetical protein WC511_05070 [Candidatus Pacearchaeota archaeon]|jgi:hypothetical protein
MNDLIPYENRAIIPYFNEDVVQPESPETAVARETPFEASRLLKALAKEETTRYALNAASSMVHDYLSEVPEERLANSNGVKISFNKNRKFFSDSEGFKIDIDLK